MAPLLLAAPFALVALVRREYGRWLAWIVRRRKRNVGEEWLLRLRVESIQELNHGVGKELAAREIHRLSPRHDGPFISH